MLDPNYPAFCREPEAYIRTGDFDGDYRTDLLCVPEPGKIQLALTNGDGFLVNGDFKLSRNEKSVNIPIALAISPSRQLSQYIFY